MTAETDSTKVTVILWYGERGHPSHYRGVYVREGGGVRLECSRCGEDLAEQCENSRVEDEYVPTHLGHCCRCFEFLMTGEDYGDPEGWTPIEDFDT